MLNHYVTTFVYTCDPAEACDRSYARLQQYTSEGHGGSIFARKLINGRVHLGASGMRQRDFPRRGLGGG